MRSEKEGVLIKQLLMVVACAGALVANPATAEAWSTNSYAKIMLHNLPVSTKNVCSRPENNPTFCSGYDAGVRSALGSFSYAYLLAINGGFILHHPIDRSAGIAGLQCGIQYASGPADGVGIDVFGWVLCADLEFQSPSPAWGSSGSGNLITWGTTGPQCMNPPGGPDIGAIAVAGYFYIGTYGSEQLRIIPRQVDNAAKVANCLLQEDVVYVDPVDYWTHLGALGGGGAPGINPCGRLGPPDPVVPTTWSGVKALVPVGD